MLLQYVNDLIAPEIEEQCKLATESLLETFQTQGHWALEKKAQLYASFSMTPPPPCPLSATTCGGGHKADIT